MTEHANTDLMTDQWATPVENIQPSWSSPAPTPVPQPEAGPPGHSGKRPLSGYSAIAAVVGLLGNGIPVVGGLIAIVLGVLGLRQVSASNGGLRGRWMAIVGLIFGTIGLIVSSLVVTGQLDLAGSAPLEPGSCVTFDPTIELVTSDEVVPCDSPHTAEYAGSGTLPEAADVPFGGNDAVFASGVEVCVNIFAGYMGEPFEARQDLDLFITHPNAEGWGDGDRTVACHIGNADGSPLVGQLTR